jgi:hypothetical protein
MLKWTFICFQMVLFDAGSSSSSSTSGSGIAAAAAATDRFPRDSRGRSISRLVIRKIRPSHAGVYTCQPASAEAVDVTVHVLNGTVLAVAADGKKCTTISRWRPLLFGIRPTYKHSLTRSCQTKRENSLK